jgi:O-antigen/teichoic acid export membrane protein
MLILLEFLGSESALGQASIIIIIVSIINISITPLQAYLSTMIRLKTKDLAEMHAIQIYHNRLKLVIIMVVAALLITFSEHLLIFFGQHSLILKDITIIAILLSCIWDYAYTATYYLLFTHHGALNNKIQIISVSLQIAALIIFIPFYDLWAAIVIPFIGGISTQIYISRAVKRLVGIHPLALY